VIVDLPPFFHADVVPTPTDQLDIRPRRESLCFEGLTIEYDARVLTPRPWTALQSRWAAELTAEAPPGRLVELCSGAGHIGLAAAALSRRTITCVDADEVACQFTRLNAERAGMAGLVEVRHARLQEALRPDELFSLAIADPPWVPSGSVGRHPDDPTLAIDGGADGLVLARACVEACRGHLADRASLLLQLGDVEQATALTALAEADGWRAGGVRHGPPGRGLVLRLLHPTW
jgi:release factor glutamine methyltransferase